MGRDGPGSGDLSVSQAEGLVAPEALRIRGTALEPHQSGACATPGQLLEVPISDSESAFSWFGVSQMNILICSSRAPGLIVTQKWANSQAYELKRAGAIDI
jgi:hypothetical protein